MKTYITSALFAFATLSTLTSCADQKLLVNTEGALPSHIPNHIIVDSTKVVPYINLDELVVIATRPTK